MPWRWPARSITTIRRWNCIPSRCSTPTGGPDIRAAEQNLIAANAQIGAAKAAYFPQISLSGFLGGQGQQLSSLFAGPSRIWNFTPQVTQPIFTAGRLKSNVKLTEALQQSALRS